MKKYVIKLVSDERDGLQAIAHKQKVAAQKKVRACILLACDQGEHGPGKTDASIAAELSVSLRSVSRLREWACEAGPIGALERRPTARVYERALDGRAEARLITIAKEDPPEGRAAWTMQLLADRLVALRVVDNVSDETVRRTLKKTTLSPTLAGIG